MTLPPTKFLVSRRLRVGTPFHRPVSLHAWDAAWHNRSTAGREKPNCSIHGLAHNSTYFWAPARSFYLDIGRGGITLEIGSWNVYNNWLLGGILDTIGTQKRLFSDILMHGRSLGPGL
jgi:hypothetical protein